jgi:flagellar protein FlaJ
MKEKTNKKENKKENKKDNEKTSFLKRLENNDQLTKFYLYLSISIPTIIFAIFAFLAGIGVLHPWEISINNDIILLGTAVDYILFAIIVSTGVFGIYELIHFRRIRKINNRFPDFVRDLAESRKAGMTFTKAIMYSSKGNYGLLTPEIQKIAKQISWGSSVEKALSDFSQRVKTKLIKRTVTLINEASRSGGNVADVLDAASKDAKEIELIEAERRAGMLSYVAVIYVSMGVFLLIMLVLCKTLIPAMTTSGSSGVAQAMGKTLEISTGDIKSLFFYATIVNTLGMGAVTGVFEEGNIRSGVKHMFIMILVTWFVFKFVVTGI